MSFGGSSSPAPPVDIMTIKPDPKVGVLKTNVNATSAIQRAEANAPSMALLSDDDPNTQRAKAAGQNILG